MRENEMKCSFIFFSGKKPLFNLRSWLNYKQRERKRGSVCFFGEFLSLSQEEIFSGVQKTVENLWHTFLSLQNAQQEKECSKNRDSFFGTKRCNFPCYLCLTSLPNLAQVLMSFLFCECVHSTFCGCTFILKNYFEKKIT